MNRLIVLATIAALMLTACGGNNGKCGDESHCTDDSLYYPIDSIPVDSEMIHQCMSEDGRIKFISWNTGTGGTCPDYAVMCLFKTDDGKVRRINLHETDLNVAWVCNVHSIKKDDGTTFYIACRTHRASSNEGYAWMSGFRIDGDSLKEVSVIDGGDDLGDYDIDICYSIYDWYNATNGEGNDWIFEYDSKSQNLYVPETEGELLMGTITDRYTVYHFNGTSFVSQGIQAHKGLHKSLSEYRNLELFFRTENHIVRIDRMNDEELRYASWKATSSISEKPELIIGKGVYDSQSSTYTFTNDGFVYICNFKEETPAETDGFLEYHKYLIVKKGGETILKEEIVDP